MTTVCLAPADTLGYLDGGGHFWEYMNWALGLRALGCNVIWLERTDEQTPADEVQAAVATLRRQLAPYGLADHLALCSWRGEPLAAQAASGCLDFDSATDADLLLNMECTLPAEIVSGFRRSALLDIDPGLLQVWWANGDIEVAAHDAYFSTGETVGRPGGPIPDAGVDWQYTRPCVALDWWPVRPSLPDAPFTTVMHWHDNGWFELGDECFLNAKRCGFLPFLGLAQRAERTLELAVDIADDNEDRLELLGRGWQLCRTRVAAGSPAAYQAYIQRSYGEFSCVRPACVRLENTWISNRTLCYLASGKPAVVEHTGPSEYLPSGEGLFRFRTIDAAAAALAAVEADYERHCLAARELAEREFDAARVVGRLLERALAVSERPRRVTA